MRSKQGIRKGDWKAIRRGMGRVELYNLGQDMGEQMDVSDQYPNITTEMTRLFTTARTKSEVFLLVKKKKDGYYVAGAGKIYHSDTYLESEWSEYMDPKRYAAHGKGVKKLKKHLPVRNAPPRKMK